MLDTKSGTYKPVDTGYSSHSFLAWTPQGSLYTIAASPTKFPQVIRVDANTLKVWWEQKLLFVSISARFNLGSRLVH